jgi:hypothetical protein
LFQQSDSQWFTVGSCASDGHKVNASLLRKLADNDVSYHVIVAGVGLNLGDKS